jgi:hypothetical protein
MRRVTPVRTLLAHALVLAMAASVAPLARGQTGQAGDPLVEARKIFVEAVADEDASRYETALEKFRRVEAVKDTANVRYRIATCLEALGRRAEALASYQAAARLAEGDKSAGDAGRESAARAAQLDRIVPHLSVVVPADAPAETHVRIDDAPVDADSLKNPIPLDPGMHTIAAEAPGRVPYRTGVKLPEGGGTVAISLVLDRVGTPGGADSPNNGTGGAGTGGTTPPDGSGLPGEQPAPSRPGPPALGVVLLGLGGALAVGSIVSFSLEASNLSKLNSDCASPPGQAPAPGTLKCPISKQSEIDAAHNAASVEAPLGWGLAIGGVAALGAGAWLLLRPRPAQGTGSVQVTPVISRTGGLLVVSGPLPR